MTTEELERIQRIECNMEFVVEHQAKFEADIARINQTLDKHNEAIVGLVQISRTLVNSQIAAEGKVSRVEERQTILDQKMAELADAERRTDERLDAFITFVEKYISSRSGGERTN